MGERWSLQAKASDENAGGSKLEPGRYLFGIESCEDSLTEKKSYPMATLKCKALEGPSVGYLTHRVTCTPQGEPGHGFTLHFLHAVGLPYGGENPDETVDIEFDSEQFIGRNFWADVEIEAYPKKGEDKANKESWTGAGSRAVKIYTQEEIDAEGGAAPAETTEGATTEAAEGDAAVEETPEQAAEREATEAAEAEAAAVAAAEAEAAAAAAAEAEATAAAAKAAAKPGLKKPLVKPPLKPVAAPAKATVKAAPVAAKASFARR